MKISFKKSVNLFSALLLLVGLTIDQPALADKWGSTYSQSRYSRYRPHRWGSGSSSSSYSGSRYRRSRYKRHNSYHYKKSHGRYNRSRSYRSTFGNDQREIKKKTIYEAPTKEDRKIKEDIEKAQIDYGPSSIEAGNLMVKYAQQYYDAKDYVKAQKMTEDIIRLNKVSSIDGLSISKVEKLRADSINKQRVSRTHPNRSGRSTNALYKPVSNSTRLSSSAGSRLYSKRHYKSGLTGSRWPSTATGTISRQGSGVTYIDYSKKPSTSITPSSSISYSPAPTTRRSRYYSPVPYSHYPRGASFIRRSYPGFRIGNPGYLDRHGLDSLNNKFKQYSHN